MGVRNWITNKASKTAEAVVTQTKDALKEKAVNKIITNSNILTTLGRIGLLAVLVILAGKDIRGGSERDSGNLSAPNTITINNYIRDDKE